MAATERRWLTVQVSGPFHIALHARRGCAGSSVGPAPGPGRARSQEHAIAAAAEGKLSQGASRVA